VRAITFEVRGRPVPQGSKVARAKVVVEEAGGILTHRAKAWPVEQAGARLKTWRELVGWSAVQALIALPGRSLRPYYQADEPLLLKVHFRLKTPQKPDRNYPTVTPDLDKLLRAVGDALQGVLYADDKQICGVFASKTWLREPGALIQVAKINQKADLKVVK
jgi:Holliday junction resolvase RusA-like endonuclease